MKWRQMVTIVLWMCCEAKETLMSEKENILLVSFSSQFSVPVVTLKSERNKFVFSCVPCHFGPSFDQTTKVMWNTVVLWHAHKDFETSFWHVHKVGFCCPMLPKLIDLGRRACFLEAPIAVCHSRQTSKSSIDLFVCACNKVQLIHPPLLGQWPSRGSSINETHVSVNCQQDIVLTVY